MSTKFEWENYKCKIPPKIGNICQELTEVRHTAHVPDANRIIEDGMIRSSLVYDESLLNKSRMCVAWVSANEWGSKGSIYGTVEFVFNWKTLIKDRKIYWVEVITKYNPSAYRFLLTDRDLCNNDKVVLYNPLIDKGPLRKSKNKWYWNGNYTSEFMIESDLFIHDCIKLKFIPHNEYYCRLGKIAYCKEKNQEIDETGRLILAHVLGNDIKTVNEQLMKSWHNSPNRVLNSSLDYGINGIYNFFDSNSNFTSEIKSKESNELILLGALSLFRKNLRVESVKLVSLLESKTTFARTLRKIVRKHFNIPNYKLPSER